jgi:8-oxo-dGTP pyrophosphatase MutT (NUDIX family)
MEEQFDVTDLAGNDVGRLTTKEVAHKDGSPHRVAAVFVFQKGQLLLQVHLGMGGQLDHTVGGHVSAGEDYETAAKREMQEEIGLDAPLDVVKLDVLSDERFGEHQFIHLFGIFETQAPDNWSFLPNEEVNELIPMPIEKVVEEMNKNPDQFTRGFINTLEAYLEVKKSNLRINKQELLKNRKGV